MQKIAAGPAHERGRPDERFAFNDGVTSARQAHLNAIPWDQPIPLVAGAVVGLVLLAVFIWIVVKGHLPYLWNEWITSVDHKRIGVMYVLLGARHAAARLHRRDHDALAAGRGLSRPGLSAARTL